MDSSSSALKAFYLVFVGVIGFEAYKFMTVTNDCTNAIVQSVELGARGPSKIANAACVKMDAHAKVVNTVLNAVAK